MIALTGTPGTGKTSISWYLNLFFREVVDVNKVAIKYFIIERDEERDSYIIDIDSLAEYLSKHLSQHSILVGHLSHLLGICDIVIVLRTHPEELKKRLEAKGWTPKKVQENVEAEALGIITQEALEISENVFEVNTTRKHPRESFYEVLYVIRKLPSDYRAPRYDWSEAILEWY